MRFQIPPRRTTATSAPLQRARRARRCLGLLTVALLVGCASGSGGSSRSATGPLTAQDLSEAGASNLLRAIETLRPQWLRSRLSSDPPVVVLDGQRYGGIERLRDIPVLTVESVRYRNASDATTRYGTGYRGGAIEVETRR